MSKNVITEAGNNRKYYMQIPQIVWANARSPYDLALWIVVKMIAGEENECYLSTPDLATLAMMSTGKVSECRKNLLQAGLLEGELRRDPGYPQPVWHLRVPDLWDDNLAWREELGHELKARIRLKEIQQRKPSLNEAGPTPDEEGLSSSEKGDSPSETKKNHIEELNTNIQRHPITDAGTSAEDLTQDNIESIQPNDEVFRAGQNEYTSRRIPPDTEFQRDFLAVCHAKRFKRLSQKSDVEAIEKALTLGGDLDEPTIYRECLASLNSQPEPQITDPFPSLPRNWYDWRADHARSHHWSVDGFIKALLDRDVLVTHCLYHLRRLEGTDEEPIELPWEEYKEISDV